MEVWRSVTVRNGGASLPGRSAPLSAARCPAITAGFHSYLSSEKFHFCLEKFHSRLSSRWAALFEGCATSQEESYTREGSYSFYAPVVFHSLYWEPSTF